MKAHINLPKDVMREVRRQVEIQESRYIHWLACAVFYTLYSKYGWGKKRLKKLYDEIYAEMDALMEFYEIEDGAGLAEIRLKRAGIDIDEWEREREQ